MQSGGGGGKDPEEVTIVRIFNLLLQNSLPLSLPSLPSRISPGAKERDEQPRGAADHGRSCHEDDP